VKYVYLIVATTRDGDEMTMFAYLDREAAEAKCAALRASRGPDALSVEAALDAVVFVRELRVQQD